MYRSKYYFSHPELRNIAFFLISIIFHIYFLSTTLNPTYIEYFLAGIYIRFSLELKWLCQV